MPWEPRIRVDARDMARAEIRPRAAPPKPRRRRVHVPRPTPTRVSSEEDDAENDAAAAVALVVAAAQDAETADAATDAAVCRSRPRGPDDDTVSTLTTRRPPGEQGTDVEDDDDDLPDEASPRDFGAALADALALAEDPRHAELLTRVLEDCVGGKEAPPPPPQASVDAALEIAALLSADAAGEIARRRSVASLDKSARKSPPPPAPATSKAVVAPPPAPPRRRRVAQSLVDLQRDRIQERAGLRAAVGRAEAAYRRLLSRAGREADANGVAKRATNRALVAAMKEVEAASLALKRYDARSARRRARPHVRPPLDLSLDAPVKRKPPTKK